MVVEVRKDQERRLVGGSLGELGRGGASAQGGGGGECRNPRTGGSRSGFSVAFFARVALAKEDVWPHGRGEEQLCPGPSPP